MNNGSMQGGSHLNSSASTTVLRTNYNIINIKSSKERNTKYGSVSKFTKRSVNKEKSMHTKQKMSIVKDISLVKTSD